MHHASHFDRSQILGNCKYGCKISNRQAPIICRLSPSSWNVGGSNTSGVAGNAATPTFSTLDEFSEPVKFGTRALEMGRCPSPLSESQVFSRSVQSNSGLSVSGQSHILGLADSQGSDPGNLGHLWQGRGGLICGQADNSLSDVVFRQGRARGSGPGCVGTQLAKIPLVCISNPTITMDNAVTDPRDDATCSDSSPILAKQAMVLSAAASTEGQTHAPCQ